MDHELGRKKAKLILSSSSLPFALDDDSSASALPCTFIVAGIEGSFSSNFVTHKLYDIEKEEFPPPSPKDPGISSTRPVDHGLPSSRLDDLLQLTLMSNDGDFGLQKFIVLPRFKSLVFQHGLLVGSIVKLSKLRLVCDETHATPTYFFAIVDMELESKFPSMLWEGCLTRMFGENRVDNNVDAVRPLVGRFRFPLPVILPSSIGWKLPQWQETISRASPWVLQHFALLPTIEEALDCFTLVAGTREFKVNHSLLQSMNAKRSLPDSTPLPPLRGRVLAISPIFRLSGPMLTSSSFPLSFRFLLEDDSGSVEIVCWNSLVKSLYYSLRLGDVIAISKYRVKRRYDSSSRSPASMKDYEISLNPSAKETPLAIVLSRPNGRDNPAPAWISTKILPSSLRRIRMDIPDNENESEDGRTSGGDFFSGSVIWNQKVSWVGRIERVDPAPVGSGKFFFQRWIGIADDDNDILPIRWIFSTPHDRDLFFNIAPGAIISMTNVRIHSLMTDSIGGRDEIWGEVSAVGGWSGWVWSVGIGRSGSSEVRERVSPLSYVPKFPSFRLYRSMFPRSPFVPLIELENTISEMSSYQIEWVLVHCSFEAVEAVEAVHTDEDDEDELEDPPHASLVPHVEQALCGPWVNSLARRVRRQQRRLRRVILKSRAGPPSMDGMTVASRIDIENEGIANQPRVAVVHLYRDPMWERSLPSWSWCCVVSVFHPMDVSKVDNNDNNKRIF